MKKIFYSTYFKLIILLASFLLLYNNTIIELIKDWSKNPNYSHGFFIPFIAGYMIWHKKADLQALPLMPNNSGILVIILSMSLFILGNIGAELFIIRITLIITILGLCIYIIGLEITKKIYIPIIYLFFMIPLPAIIWNKIAFPLQIFTSKATEIIINAIEIPIFREGNIIHLANATLEVVDACSGLRSLVSLLAICAALAYICRLVKIKKWILFLSAVPIAILVNIIRLSLTAIIASNFGEKVTQGFSHQISGLLVYFFGLIMVAGLYIVLSRIRINV